MIVSNLKRILLGNKWVEFCYWYCRTFSKRISFPSLNIFSSERTVEELLKSKSISRFGDGEFKILLNRGGIVFQTENKELVERLEEVIKSDLENHIVGIPEALGSTRGLKLQTKYFWIGFINCYGKQLSKYLDCQKKYGNAGISRFYLGQINKKNAEKILEKLKMIWFEKDILIIEGMFSRMGVGNDLFNTSRSVKRILCPPENAFNSYQEILKASKKYGNNKLILIALGPTATVLSYDLAKAGYWALDIGHIDVEYMWMLQNATKQIPIKGRYVSEARDVKDFEIQNEYKAEYEQSIVEIINS